MRIFIKDKFRFLMALILMIIAITITIVFKNDLSWDIGGFLFGLSLGIGLFWSEKHEK